MATQKKTVNSTNRKSKASSGTERSVKTKQTKEQGRSSQRRSSAPKSQETTKEKKAPTQRTRTASAQRNSTAPVQRTRATERREERTPVPQRERSSIVSTNVEIFLWLLLGFCVILALSNFFGIGGVVGKGISYFFFGLFGVISYVIPFILFFGVTFVAVNIHARSLPGKVLSFLLLLITLSCFCQLVSGEFDGDQSIIEYFRTGADLKTGGGLFGGILCCLLCPYFGTIVTWIVNFILFIISIILLTGQSAIGGIYKGGKKAVNSYHNNRSRREQRYQEIDDNETSGPRREHVYRGVSMDTKLNPMDTLEDVHEIIPTRKSGTEKLAGSSLGNEGSGIIRSLERPSRAKKLVESVPETEAPKAIQMEFPIQGQVEDPVTDTMSDSDFTDIPEEPEMNQTETQTEANPGIDRKIKNPKSSKEEQEKDRLLVDAEIRKNEQAPKKEYKYPSVRLLGRGNAGGRKNATAEVRETAAKLQNTLESFGVNVTITNVSCGPAVTRYELMPEQGVKVSKIVNLSDDIKLNLAAADIRIEAPIPGKAAVGIEVPNKENSAVYLRELLETEAFQSAKSNLSFAVGKDIAGQPVIADIAKMPHLLIAGATGSGKSVCINTLIMSILYKADPANVKLIMIDPKVVELSVYNGIPHLMIPVVTDPKKASGALNWAVAEMTRRYELFSQIGVRDLAGYNKRVEAIPDGTEGKPDKLPQIVIIVDELADLMMVAPGEVEDAICRLAQLARAAGLHLIIATQRPSVNVITGLIKANMPSRIAFSVTSGVDSRTILDMNGAEKLLGKGDMLFYPQGYPKPVRVQGAFVTDEEVGKVTDFLKDNLDENLYGSQQVIDIDKYAGSSSSGTASSDGGGSDRDSYFAEAGKFIIEKDKASIGMLQRVFKIGFNRAARIMDQLADAGVVGPEEGTKPRKILMSMEEFEQYIDEYV